MLEDIRTNINKLIALYEGERQKADMLGENLRQSQAQVEMYRTQITELNSQIDNLKLSMAFSGAGDTDAAKARIDKLLREIDRCIKLLEQ